MERTPVTPDGTVRMAASLPPHATTEPSARSARLCVAPAATATTFDRPVGTLVWPWALSPHAVTRPFSPTTSPWFAPAATATARTDMAGTVDCPRSLAPTASTVPSPRRAIVWASPATRFTRLVQSAPNPIWPEELSRHPTARFSNGERTTHARGLSMAPTLLVARTQYQPAWDNSAPSITRVALVAPAMGCSRKYHCNAGGPPPEADAVRETRAPRWVKTLDGPEANLGCVMTVTAATLDVARPATLLAISR